MAKLTAAEQIEKGKELTPARLLAFKICQRNPQITAAELGKALKEEGFELAKTTYATWLTRFKKGGGVRTFDGRPDTVAQKPQTLAFKIWEKNPQITAAELGKALKEEGFELAKSTCYSWLTRFKKGKGVRKYKREQPTAMKPSEITLEQIIKAVGSVEALSLLFYQGVMEELKRRDSAYDVLKQDCLKKDQLISLLKHELDEVTRERNRIIREFNEKIASVKVGTLTLDQVEHKLIPKK